MQCTYTIRLFLGFLVFLTWRVQGWRRLGDLIILAAALTIATNTLFVELHGESAILVILRVLVKVQRRSCSAGLRATGSVLGHLYIVVQLALNVVLKSLQIAEQRSLNHVQST